MSKFDDGCTEGGSKVQPCGATSQGLTAYKSAPYRNIEMHTVVQFFPCVGQWYITAYCYKVPVIKIKNEFLHKKDQS